MVVIVYLYNVIEWHDVSFLPVLGASRNVHLSFHILDKLLVSNLLVQEIFLFLSIRLEFILILTRTRKHYSPTSSYATVVLFSVAYTEAEKSEKTVERK